MIARRLPLVLEDYGVSVQNGFLPDEFPLQKLPDPYYDSWEAIMAHLPALLHSRQARKEIDELAVLSTSYLRSEREWQRAYSILGFLTHSYMWCGENPAEVLPMAVSIPFLEVSSHLDLPPIATYAGTNLWNFAPRSKDVPLSVPENLRLLHTFTGTRDEEWFVGIAIAMDARCADIIPVMLDAIDAAKDGDSLAVEKSLLAFEACARDLGNLLERLYELCDPYVFYYQIRPFLAGSKNMAVAGLPNGVFYDEGEGVGSWRQYSGGSAAQSSLIQFLDAVLSVDHNATGELKDDGNAVARKGGYLLV